MKLPLKLQRLLRVHLALALQALTLKQDLVLKPLDLVKDLAQDVARVHLALQAHLALERLQQVKALAWNLARALARVHLALALQDLKPLDSAKVLAQDLVRVHPIHVLAQHASRL